MTYSASNGAWRSADHGDTWHRLASTRNLLDIAVNPVDPSVLLAPVGGRGFAGDDATTWDMDSQLLTSDDGGASWSEVAKFPWPAVRVLAVAVSPADDRVVYAAGWDGTGGGRDAVILKSVDHGQTWTRVFELADSQFSTLALDPRTSDVVYAGSMGKVLNPGLYGSRDGGRTWSRIHHGGPGAIVVDPLDPDVLHVSMRERVQGVYHFEWSGEAQATVAQPATWGEVKSSRSRTR